MWNADWERDRRAQGESRKTVATITWVPMGVGGLAKGASPVASLSGPHLFSITRRTVTGPGILSHVHRPKSRKGDRKLAHIMMYI